MTVTWIDVFGFAAFLLNVVGNLLLAYERTDGWLVRIASIVLWGVYAGFVASVPMVLNAVTFFGINCVGWWRWRRRRRTDVLSGHAESCPWPRTPPGPCNCGRLA